MKFTIDRKIWLRGEGSFSSYLFRPSDGKMCCIGQMCKQLGVPVEQLTLKTTIRILIRDTQHPDGRDDGANEEQVDKLLETLNGLVENRGQVEWLTYAYIYNDRENFMPPEEREAALTELFAKHGHELEFIN